jgi:hypothetical protein
MHRRVLHFGGVPGSAADAPLRRNAGIRLVPNVACLIVFHKPTQHRRSRQQVGIWRFDHLTQVSLSSVARYCCHRGEVQIASCRLAGQGITYATEESQNY